MHHFFEHPINRVIAATALVAIAFAGLAYGYLNFKQAKYAGFGPTVINVSGVGEVNAKPDIGSFSFSVNAESEEAGAAQSEAAEKMNDITAYLKEQGVDEDDIKHEYYSLQPRYRQEVARSSVYVPVNMVEDGFTVTQGVSVKVRNLDMSGELIAEVGNRGAQNISNLNFVIDNDQALAEEARIAAIEDAKSQAEKIAESLGMRVVKTTSYYEENNYDYPYGGYGRQMDMVATEGGMVPPEFSTGENTVTKRVSVSFELR